MPQINVTIDGISGTVPAGSTVLDAAEHLGVRIPTLCHQRCIKPIGACRICLVEVEKQRALQPACTFPVSDGTVVHTASPKVVDARRFVLQLLFSERNHFCMFCQSSGSCELQSLAYEHGLDQWVFDRTYPSYQVDASRPYFSLDPNRCILCRRCIRACDELVGNNTLGLMNRGAETEVIADMAVPFGESSCVSCGTCMQVCPTGALMDRASAYMGAETEVTRVKSRCTACSVGCGVELVVRDNRVLRVEGDWDAEPNRGLLCDIGRFSLLHEKRTRLTAPMVRGEAGLAPATWDEALAAIASRRGAPLQAVVSGLATQEAAEAVMSRFPGEKTVLEGEGACPPADLAALDKADCFIVVSTDLTRDYQVAGFAIKRGCRHRHAPLILVGDLENGLSAWAWARFSMAEAEKALPMAAQAQNPVILTDSAGRAVAARLAEALPQAKVVALAPGGNSLGMASVGLQQAFAPSDASGDSYYLLAAERAQPSQALLQALEGAAFVVIQAAYLQPWDEVADVLLPSPLVFEKEGTVVNTEGRANRLAAAVQNGRPSEVEVIERVGAVL
ncbi:MAG: NADH-quinone oxidoreductase subunit G [Anaerolineae bacterium]